MKRLFILPFLFISFAWAETLHCGVTKVIDGGSLECFMCKRRVKFKMYQIETPELAQKYGKEAKDYLSKSIYKSLVDLDIYSFSEHSEDATGIVYKTTFFLGKEGCFLPKGFVSDVNASDNDCMSTKDINLDMIEQGYAWVSPFVQSNPEYIKAEQEARKAKRGLWADPNPIPPWEWREKQKTKK